ncbi:sporulation membrane protein YtaF [Sporosarcina pasteurii]|uniref:sporulation membrane protein YtaF n=1 Tax=Sporosarcina pasteurii TaxID=1474 RepID=UPI000E1BFBD3|nr:sporulation membrane protein YtaF [Sporosarcina pasteurii]MDS9471275.1 sporulation membrane protein YtaF [Sporosarcina pasteurii]QBQ07062.1 sporulation membrane protein YtaF [Sporosarcina pasteurii]
MIWIAILAFAISSSIDNLGVGMSYGIQKVQISAKQNLLIATICFLFSMGGIYLGIWIFTIIPGMLPVILGAVLLFIIGIRIILLAKPKHHEQPEVNEQETGLKGILKNPEVVGDSGGKSIGWIESIVLGVALSANALTNGIGAGLIGLSPLAISITAAIGSFFSVWIGVKIGSKVADIRIGAFTLGQFGTLLSGVILLVIAVVAFSNIYN